METNVSAYRIVETSFSRAKTSFDFAPWCQCTLPTSKCDQLSLLQDWHLCGYYSVLYNCVPLIIQISLKGKKPLLMCNIFFHVNTED